MENNSQQSAAATGYPYHHLNQQQQLQLELFWSYQRQEIEHVNNFKNQQLPLARIKKIMKVDENVRKISAEAPILFAKACELFIQELTICSGIHAEENKRRTLQKHDVTAAISQNDSFDFLSDVVHKDKSNELQVTGLGPSRVVASAASGIPYNYPPPDPSGVVMGRTRVSPSVNVQPTPPPLQGWQSVWQAAEDNASGGNGGQDNVDGQS